MVRLAPGLVRIPDLAFISWQRLPERRVPTDPIPGLVPDLVVEVLSDGNTAAEMDRKRREYFGRIFSLPLAELFAELDRQGFA